MIPKHYLPNVGDLFKLRLMEMYAGEKLPDWAWLKAIRVVRKGEPGVNGGAVSADAVVALHFNGGKTEGEEHLITPQMISPPVYWEPVYTVSQYDEATFAKIREWLKAGRGVTVWGCHDLSMAGRMMFTPGDTTSGKPHWSMEAVETTHDPERFKFLLIEKHRIPTGNPVIEGPFTKEKYKAAKKKAIVERKKVLAERKRAGVKVHNIKDGSGVSESWYETEKTIPVLPL